MLLMKQQEHFLNSAYQKNCSQSCVVCTSLLFTLFSSLALFLLTVAVWRVYLRSEHAFAVMLTFILLAEVARSQHIWQQWNVVPHLINLWLTAIFNMFDCVIANRQTIAAYVVWIHQIYGFQQYSCWHEYYVGISCRYIKLTRLGLSQIHHMNYYATMHYLPV